MPNETPKLTAEEALAIIAAKTAPNVTKESIDAKIDTLMMHLLDKGK